MLKEIINQTEARPIFSSLIDSIIYREMILQSQENKTSFIDRIKNSLTNFRKNSSRNSIFDSKKLIDRFVNSEDYSSTEAKISLINHDLDHYVREMAIVEPVTRFNYKVNFAEKKVTGDGYHEDINLLLSNFTKDLCAKGFSASRSTIDAVTLLKVQEFLCDFVKKGENKSIILTSPPDISSNGYPGVDSLYDWDHPETNHTFYFHAQAKNITESGFEIHTTQYRLWPNIRQNLQIHERLNCPVPIDILNNTKKGDVPAIIMSNLIAVNNEELLNLDIKEDNGPIDENETEIEKKIRQVLFLDCESYQITHHNIPTFDHKDFWKTESEYRNFYINNALPIFNNIEKNKNKLTKKQLQMEINKLDDLFLLYSSVLTAYIKNNNSNPLFEKVFFERNKLKQIKEKINEKIIKMLVKLKYLEAKKVTEIPSVNDLTEKHQILSNLREGKKINKSEKMKILELWGFLNYAASFSSLLQCGILAPFTLPISILKQPFGLNSIKDFSIALKTIPTNEKSKLLDFLNSERYVELDLRSKGAKKVFVVPKSYLEGKGCVVDEDGNVLGPCIDPSTGKRISLEDPRETMAYPLSMSDFLKMKNELEKQVNQRYLESIENILLNEKDLAENEKTKAREIIKKIKKMIIKPIIGLQEFVTGEFINTDKKTSKQWLKDLLIEVKRSSNPIDFLTNFVNTKILEEDVNYFEF